LLEAVEHGDDVAAEPHVAAMPSLPGGRRGDQIRPLPALMVPTGRRRPQAMIRA